MRMVVAIASLAAVLAVSACDDKKNSDKNASVEISGSGQEMTMSSPDGKITVHGITGDDAKAEMPAFLTPYPGATTKMAMATQTPNGHGATMIFETGDQPADVVAFYKKEAEGAGMKDGMSGAFGHSTMYMAGNDKDHSSVRVSAVRKGDRTMVNLTWTPPQ